MPHHFSENVGSYAEEHPPSYRYLPGEEYVHDDGRIFRFLRLMDAVVAQDGFIAEWASTTYNYVTVDRVGGSSLGRIPAGVACGRISSLRPWAFWLVRGLHTAIPNDTGSIGAGIQLTTSPTQDGGATTASAYTNVPIGSNRGPTAAIVLNAVEVSI